MIPVCVIVYLSLFFSKTAEPIELNFEGQAFGWLCGKKIGSIKPFARKNWLRYLHHQVTELGGFFIFSKVYNFGPNTILLWCEPA